MQDIFWLVNLRIAEQSYKKLQRFEIADSKGEIRMATSFWTSKSVNGWQVKREGATRPSSVHNSQSGAWNEARRLARGAGGDAYLKGSDGRIRAQNSYKEDAPRKKA